MPWGAIIGAGVGLIGSMMSSDAQKDAANAAAEAAEFRPFNIQDPFGLGRVSVVGNQITSSLNPYMQAVRDQSMGGLLGTFGLGMNDPRASAQYNYPYPAQPGYPGMPGGPSSGNAAYQYAYADGIVPNSNPYSTQGLNAFGTDGRVLPQYRGQPINPNTQLGQAILRGFNGSNPNMLAGRQGADPNFAPTYQLPGGPTGLFGGLPAIGRAAKTAGQSIPGLFAGQVNDYDQGYGMQQAATARGLQSSRGLFNQSQGIMGDALGLTMAPGILDNPSRRLIGQGMGLLNSDYTGTRDAALARLRDSARPMEERAVNSRVQELYNRGVLSDTSGARSLGELALQQERADIDRQNLAEQIGLNQFTAEQRAGLGQVGQGFTGMLQGGRLGLDQAGRYADVGFRGINASNLLNEGMIGLDTLLGQRVSNRGQDRMRMAQEMFGFGDAAQRAGLGIQDQLLKRLMSLNADQRATIGLSGDFGKAGAAAGANQGGFMMQGAGDPLGGFLASAGGTLLNSGLEKIFDNIGSSDKPTAPKNSSKGGVIY